VAVPAVATVVKLVEMVLMAALAAEVELERLEGDLLAGEGLLGQIHQDLVLAAVAAVPALLA
jgi:hypothetical protein